MTLPTTKVLVLLSTASLYDILSKAVRQNRKERYSSKMASGRNGPLAGWMKNVHMKEYLFWGGDVAFFYKGRKSAGRRVAVGDIFFCQF